MRTHYDNLRIAENAPDEVVRAAYRALSQLFHPDKNPGDGNAHRVMQVINDAYATLSDPARRRHYDAFLAQARTTESSSKHSSSPLGPSGGSTRQKRRSFWQRVVLILCWDFRLTLFGGIALCVGISSLVEEKRPRQPYTPTVPAPKYGYLPIIEEAPRISFVRPSTAPNGVPWPTHAGYISGYPFLADAGLSSVTVDNTRNTSDVFLKLVSLDSPTAFPVRVCFIPALSQFVFQNVKRGRYDVRYRDLSSGGYSKTEEFILAEYRTYDGTEFSNLSLTLYKVAHGNMHTSSIDASEF